MAGGRPPSLRPPDAGEPAGEVQMAVGRGGRLPPPLSDVLRDPSNVSGDLRQLLDSFELETCAGTRYQLNGDGAFEPEVAGDGSVARGDPGRGSGVSSQESSTRGCARPRMSAPSGRPGQHVGEAEILPPAVHALARCTGRPGSRRYTQAWHGRVRSAGARPGRQAPHAAYFSAASITMRRRAVVNPL